MKNLVLISTLALIMLFYANCAQQSAPPPPAPTTYTGNLVFWYTKDVSTQMQASGVTKLIFFVNGNVAGSVGITNYWNIQPNCGDSGSITYKIDMGTYQTYSYPYYVLDQRGNKLWEGTVTYQGNQCVAKRILV